jgi:hypothetical protein
MITSCGESWLDTWWSTIERGRTLGVTNDWVRGDIKPSSFLEFAMQTELIIFVKLELQKDMTASPDITRNPKLLYYTLIGGAVCHWQVYPFLYHSPETLLDLARFLIRKGSSVHAMLELDTALDRLKLMEACDNNRPEFWTPEENKRGAELRQHGGSNVTNVTESMSLDNRGYDNDGETTDVHQVSTLHLALAIACSLAVVPKWYLTVCRLDMLRVLVEASGNARTSNYRNYWSDHNGTVFERSPLHYLLSFRFKTNHSADDDTGDRNTDVSNAVQKCIIAFLDHGADPNAVDSIGISILELAMASHPYTLVQVLLEKGAKVTPRLLSPSGEPTPKAGGILNELRWRRPECYTPEARRIAVGYNPHWGVLQEEELQGSEVEQPQGEVGGNLLGTVGLHVGNLVGSVKDWTWKRITDSDTN